MLGSQAQLVPLSRELETSVASRRWWLYLPFMFRRSIFLPMTTVLGLSGGPKENQVCSGSQANPERNGSLRYQLLLWTLPELEFLTSSPWCSDHGQALAPSQMSAELPYLLSKPREGHGEVSKTDAQA